MANSSQRETLKTFAERLLKLREDQKADIETLADQAKSADVDMPTLKRLVAFLSKDEEKRTEQEALDDQAKFLMGLLPEPAELPPDSQVATARALLADKMTIRDVAKTMGISVGKAHQLKVKASLFDVHVHFEMNARRKIGHNSAIKPCWALANGIVADEIETAKRAENERAAKLEQLRLAREATRKRNAEIDATDLEAARPPFLRRPLPQQVV